MQAVALLLFFCLVVFPIAVLPALTASDQIAPLDPANTGIFAESIVDGPDGQLQVEPTNRLTALAADAPDVWFYASTLDGRSVSYGTVPSAYSKILSSLWIFEGGMIRPGPDSGLSTLQLAKHDSVAGQVIVASGGGRSIGVASLISLIWAVVSIALLLVLSIAAAVIVPRVVRRELRGLKSAAEQAKRIDINARGTRLPTEGVPEEVRALVDAVNDGLGRLDKSFMQRERFLADAAHELRTPITILQTRLETSDPFPKQARLLMDVARLASLADQLLDLQRLDLGQSIFARVNLVALAESVVGDMAPLAIKAGYEISLNAPEQPVTIRGDEPSLTRALTNVVQNAIIHGSQRGQIEVTVGATGELSVADEGPGVAPDERDKIFEPFYRLKPQATGAGLGLNLVSSIVQHHNGRVAVTASPSGGACFVMSFPLAA